jgi:ABC-2 type transport system permease protein
MSTQSNAIPASFDSHGTAPVTMNLTRPFYWSVRRELWENRSIYIAPLAVAAVALFGYLIASMGYAISTTNLAQRRAALEEPYSFATALIMGAAFLVSIFYSLDALHSERRDRSILFWKSLPVSDLTTVLSKASIPLIVLPLLSFAIVVATVLIMLLLTTLVLLGSGVSAATVCNPA